MMQREKKGRVFVGVSGGVDSSLSLALLKSQGYEVVGVFIRTWQPDWLECSWREEKKDAMRVCAQLDIPFVELNLEKEYEQGVVHYMLDEYRQGRTPNPDVMCNRAIKFGAFFRWAREQGADFVATGHYARIRKQGNHFSLLRGVDRNKDQSYFLWTLKKKQLPHILFPVGEFEKSDVRKKAKEFGIVTAPKPDSQGICFLGDVDMKDFLRHYIDEREGDVVDEKGNIIGTHSGVMFFTLGERHGFTIHKKATGGGPYYVIGKDGEKNILMVSQEPEKGEEKGEDYLLSQVNNLEGIFSPGREFDVQIRYRGSLKRVSILSYNKDKGEMHIRFHTPDYTIALGQSIVFYDGDICLGGGIIERKL